MFRVLALRRSEIRFALIRSNEGRTLEAPAPPFYLTLVYNLLYQFVWLSQFLANNN